MQVGLALIALGLALLPAAYSCGAIVELPHYLGGYPARTSWWMRVVRGQSLYFAGLLCVALITGASKQYLLGAYAYTLLFGLIGLVILGKEVLLKRRNPKPVKFSVDRAVLFLSLAGAIIWFLARLYKFLGTWQIPLQTNDPLFHYQGISVIKFLGSANPFNAFTNIAGVVDQAGSLYYPTGFHQLGVLPAHWVDAVSAANLSVLAVVLLVWLPGWLTLAGWLLRNLPLLARRHLNINIVLAFLAFGLLLLPHLIWQPVFMHGQWPYFLAIALLPSAILNFLIPANYLLFKPLKEFCQASLEQHDKTRQPEHLLNSCCSAPSFKGMAAYLLVTLLLPLLGVVNAHPSGLVIWGIFLALPLIVAITGWLWWNFGWRRYKTKKNRPGEKLLAWRPLILATLGVIFSWAVPVLAGVKLLSWPPLQTYLTHNATDATALSLMRAAVRGGDVGYLLLGDWRHGWIFTALTFLGFCLALTVRLGRYIFLSAATFFLLLLACGFKSGYLLLLSGFWYCDPGRLLCLLDLFRIICAAIPLGCLWALGDKRSLQTFKSVQLLKNLQVFRKTSGQSGIGTERLQLGVGCRRRRQVIPKLVVIGLALVAGAENLVYAQAVNRATEIGLNPAAGFADFHLQPVITDAELREGKQIAGKLDNHDRVLGDPASGVAVFGLYSGALVVPATVGSLRQVHNLEQAALQLQLGGALAWQGCKVLHESKITYLYTDVPANTIFGESALTNNDLGGPYLQLDGKAGTGKLWRLLSCQATPK